jgi:hypothetical protein
MKNALAILGLLLLTVAEVLRVYFIMPFPGSQYKNTLDAAYWIGNNILCIRIVLLCLIALPLLQLFRSSGKWIKLFAAILAILYMVVFYFFNYRFLAETMFYQPRHLNFSSAAANNIAADKQVLGVEINGETKAYPIQLIGYHHQVRDTVGGKPVMVTYCTVCRTGRVFSPFVNGKNEEFRLVGMDHFNAMFEDSRSKSWWRQVSGEAVVGPLKGQKLTEIPSRQMSLAAWLNIHPSSMIMQPDSSFKEQYDQLQGYDKGRLKNSLEKRDSLSWKDKSWVVGIKNGNYAKAIDWNMLVSNQLIQDSLPQFPFLVVLERDSVSFHSYNRTLEGSVLRFEKMIDDQSDLIYDLNTRSIWNKQGLCIEGTMKGKSLSLLQSYQEYWHSWRTFNPHTSR